MKKKIVLFYYWNEVKNINCKIDAYFKDKGAPFTIFNSKIHFPQLPTEKC